MSEVAEKEQQEIPWMELQREVLERIADNLEGIKIALLKTGLELDLVNKLKMLHTRIGSQSEEEILSHYKAALEGLSTLISDSSQTPKR